MHEIFNHESVTRPWVNTLKILDVDSEEAVLPNSVTLSEGYSQERGDRITAWVDIRVEPEQGNAIWVHAGGEDGRPSFAVAIPRDQNCAIPVRLDLAFRALRQSVTWMLEGMSARLAPPPRDFHPKLRRIWGSLWEIQRVEALSDLARAGHAAGELVRLERALREKMIAPIASAIAGGLLLRADALNYLHDWPRNLAKWFSWLADGPVLWSETLLRRSKISRGMAAIAALGPNAAKGNVDQARRLMALVGQPDYIEAREYFTKVAERGPPLLTTSLVIAAEQCLFWRRALETSAFSGQERIKLAAACDTIDRPATYAGSDGVFAGFIWHDDPLMPHEVVGMRQCARVRA